MTIEEESKSQPQYKTFNPYKLDIEHEAQRETISPVSQTIPSRTLGSLKQNGKGFGRLQSVNDHHKTTLGGVKRMKFKPTVPTTRRISTSQAPPKSDVPIKTEEDSHQVFHQHAGPVSRIRRQGDDSNNKGKREPNNVSSSVERLWPFDDRLTESTSMYMYEGMELPVSLKSFSSALLANEQSKSVNISMEVGNRISRVGPLANADTLTDLSTINNGDLFLIQMPSILPSFRPAGDEKAITAMQETVEIKEEAILEISESSTLLGNKIKQRDTAVSKKTEKIRVKTKPEPRKKGKENRSTKKTVKETSSVYKSSPQKNIIASNEDSNSETVKSMPEKRPEIDLAHLPDGQLGSLQVYKSGKVKLKFGDLLMDVSYFIEL
ncbi:hypothetical protein VKS41_005840 [Umbelopsis sp. WA50703]